MSRPSVISFKGKSASRSKLTSRAALAARKIPYKVHLDGVDVTPWPLMESVSIANLALSAAAAVTTTSTTQHLADFMELGVHSEDIPPAEPSSSLMHVQSAMAGALAGIPSLTAVAKLDNFYHRKSSSFMSVILEESSAYVPKVEEQVEEPDKERPHDSTRISFVLDVTPYIELLDIPSETRVSTDPDYEYEARDKELFLASRAAIKTRSDAILQTADLWVRTKWTQERRKQRRNQLTMVTPWEIWDLANSGKEEDARTSKLRKRQIRKLATEGAMASRATHQSTSTMSENTVIDEPSSESSDKRSEGTDLRSANSRYSVGYNTTSDRKWMLSFGKEFKLAAMVIERLVQERESNPHQMLFCGIPPKNVLDPDLRYVYEPKTLWTFETENTKDRCVTSIAWSENRLIFAVGYGRYYFTPANPNGLVNIWNIKNPLFPERVIQLKSPVNACAFSKRHPNLLAIGQLNGSMTLVDISTYDCSILFESTETGEPLWSITWLQMESHGEDEILLAGTQDGRIMRFRRSEQFQSVQMMRVPRSQGSIRGISRLSTAMSSVPSSHYTAVLTLCECPTETDGYLVGTDDGCIHLCSAHYLHRHLAAAACHLGPVYACEVSPFVDKVYLTSGADWTIRIWAHGIYDPLLSFSSSMEPVDSAAWSTTDSCLFASVSGSELSIWDLRRKIPAPAGTARSPTHDKFSVVSWAKDGALLAGDRAGRVHVMRVEGLPLPSFYQQKTLATSIRKALEVTKPELYAAFKKLGNRFR